jgi:hypothetical protein
MRTDVAIGRRAAVGRGASRMIGAEWSFMTVLMDVWVWIGLLALERVEW